MDANEVIGGPVICPRCGEAYNFNAAHLCKTLVLLQELATLRSENERLKAQVTDEEVEATWFLQGMLHKSEIKRLLEAFIASRTQATQKGSE